MVRRAVDSTRSRGANSCCTHSCSVCDVPDNGRAWFVVTNRRAASEPRGAHGGTSSRYPAATAAPYLTHSAMPDTRRRFVMISTCVPSRMREQARAHIRCHPPAPQSRRSPYSSASRFAAPLAAAMSAHSSTWLLQSKWHHSLSVLLLMRTLPAPLRTLLVLSKRLPHPTG